MCEEVEVILRLLFSVKYEFAKILHNSKQYVKL